MKTATAATLNLRQLKKPIRPDRSGHLGPEDFDSNRPVVLEILGEIDCRHAPATKLFFDRVAVGEGMREAIQEVRQASKPSFGGTS